MKNNGHLFVIWVFFANKPAPPIAAKPESIKVLVNKQHALPESYEPVDLVYAGVPFTFT